MNPFSIGGERSLLGVRAAVLDSAAIGKQRLEGAGAVVTFGKGHFKTLSQSIERDRIRRNVIGHT